MTQYIDKSAVIAEIEKRMQELRPTNTHKMQVGEKMDRDVLMWLNALTWVKKILDAIEVKESPTDVFIKKVEDYLNSQLYDWVSITNPNQRSCANVIPKENFIEDFKKYMKGEKL